jgi:hypothetical protein
MKTDSTTLVQPTSRVTNRILGSIAMLGAPMLLIDYYLNGHNGGGQPYVHTSFGGVLGFAYIIGWMCSIEGLVQLKATGQGKFGRLLLLAQFAFLTLANSWSTYEIMAPGAFTPLYNNLDHFWPLSNLLMVIVGITVAVNKGLPGWKRYVPLAVGLWLPLTMLLQVVFGQSTELMMVSGLYSAITWTLMGYVIRTSEPTLVVAR